jgi:hypothetical protein
MYFVLLDLFIVKREFEENGTGSGSGFIQGKCTILLCTWKERRKH